MMTQQIYEIFKNEFISNEDTQKIKENTIRQILQISQDKKLLNFDNSAGQVYIDENNKLFKNTIQFLRNLM